jgi:hypothetical protein
MAAARPFGPEPTTTASGLPVILYSPRFLVMRCLVDQNIPLRRQ